MCHGRELFLLIFIIGLMIAFSVPGYNWASRHDFGAISSVLIGFGAAAPITLGYYLLCHVVAVPVYLIRRNKDQNSLNHYANIFVFVLFACLSIFGIIMIVKDFVLWII
jgi:hypothetical protein